MIYPSKFSNKVESTLCNDPQQSPMYTQYFDHYLADDEEQDRFREESQLSYSTTEKPTMFSLTN